MHPRSEPCNIYTKWVSGSLHPPPLTSRRNPVSSPAIEGPGTSQSSIMAHCGGLGRWRDDFQMPCKGLGQMGELSNQWPAASCKGPITGDEGEGENREENAEKTQCIASKLNIHTEETEAPTREGKKPTCGAARGVPRSMPVLVDSEPRRWPGCWGTLRGLSRTRGG